MQGAKIAQGLLLNLISDPNQTSLVWKILCDEGQKLTSNPGRRDVWAWRSLLQKHSIFISGQEKIEKFSQQPNWPELCRKMLPTELDSNPLISGDGVTLGIEDILPLDLAERKERPRPTRDPSPENFQQTLEEQETSLPYDQLFAHVLAKCRSLNQQGKGIAIIGEPGAGKTTLLCAIANWILERNELPIFVALRDLDSKLEDYILQAWLRKAGNVRRATEQFQDALVEQFNAGQVWLLLDGIDEMNQADQTLYNLAQELEKGWLSNARIVLTCRINVWDTNRNDLDSKFKSFRSRGLKHEDQVVFIRKFFTKAQQPETGEKLIKEIKNAPLRLKDLIKSPLWITLLCRTWKRRLGKLPKTKSELYRGFVNTLYEWKNKPCISVQKRCLLEQALGEVAAKIIDQEVSRFSFSESFICEELNRFDPSFFSIACKLGWINKLGIAAGNSEEPIYAFLHPTFQEYFAAKAVHDNHFFLHHVSDIPKKGKYRIFEPQWKECFLFWLGREDVSKEHKNDLIEALANLVGECGGFYQYKAKCLAVSGISEFAECNSKDPLIEEVISWHLGFFKTIINDSNWTIFLNPNELIDTAGLALRETDKTSLIHSTVSLARKNYKNSIGRSAVEFLGLCGYHNLKAVEGLLEILKLSSDKRVRSQSIKSLARIIEKDINLIDFARRDLIEIQSASDRKRISIILNKLQFCNLKNNPSLKKNQDLYKIRSKLDASSNDDEKLASALKLLQMMPQDDNAISTLIEILDVTKSKEIKKQIIFSLGTQVQNNTHVVNAFSKILCLEKDEKILVITSEMIRDIGYKSKHAVSALCTLIESSYETTLKYHYAECLGDVDPGNLLAANTLFEALSEGGSDDDLKVYAIDRLSRVGSGDLNIQNLIKEEFPKLLTGSESQRIQTEVTWHLWLHSAIDVRTIYNSLAKQIFEEEYEEKCALAVWRLRRIFRDKVFHADLAYDAVSTLSKALPKTACQDKIRFHSIYFNLAIFFAQKMSYSEFHKAWHNC